MLPLPWWILGTSPDQDEEDQKQREKTQETTMTLELQDSISSTPDYLLYRTPSEWIGNRSLVDPTDNLPTVDNLPNFLKAAKRRSSTTIENETPKLKRAASSVRSYQKKFERIETEVMNKNDDGFDFDETCGIFISESPRPQSPVDRWEASEKTEEKSANKSFLNQTIHSENGKDEESSPMESPVREFPMFFTSFNDTTVLFNSTINGDLNAEQSEDAVGNWVFKSDTLREEKKNNIKKSEKKKEFKQPTENRKKRLETSTTPTDKPKQSTSARDKGKRERSQTPSTSKAVPKMERRETPSRKAKTYKSLVDMF